MKDRNWIAKHPARWTLQELDAAIYDLMARRATLRARQRELQALRGQLAAKEQVAARLEGWTDDEIGALRDLAPQLEKPSDTPWRDWFNAIFKRKE